jgi:hypothetical protein
MLKAAWALKSPLSAKTQKTFFEPDVSGQLEKEADDVQTARSKDSQANAC